MNSKTYSKKKSRFSSTFETNFGQCRPADDEELFTQVSAKRKVSGEFEFDDNEDGDCTPPKKQTFSSRRTIVDSENDEDVAPEPPQNTVLPLEEDIINVKINRKLRKKSEKKKTEKKAPLRGYSKEEEFIQPDDEEDFFDPDAPEKVTHDTLTPEEREAANIQIIQDAYQNDAHQKHTRRSMQEKRQSFTQAAVVKHVTLSTTVDLKASIMLVFSGAGNVNLFVEKFDKLLLNETFASFKRPQHRLMINAALAQGEWKCRDLQSRQSAVCFLCNVLRLGCRDAIVNHSGRVLGYVGSECIDRWMLLEQVYRLRKEILSEYGRGEDEGVASRFVKQIDDLKNESLRTLQILTNKFLPDDQKIDDDAVDDDDDDE